LIVVSGHKFNAWIVRLLFVAAPLVAQKPTMTESFIRALANDFGTVGRAAHNSFPNYLSFSPIPPIIVMAERSPVLAGDDALVVPLGLDWTMIKCMCDHDHNLPLSPKIKKDIITVMVIMITRITRNTITWPAMVGHHEVMLFLRMGEFKP
jgi:hypothetical protein